jgi:hypothetical protein
MTPRPAFKPLCASGGHGIEAAESMMIDLSIVHIIDDDAGMRNSLAWMLKRSGFRFGTHESAGAFLIKPARTAHPVLSWICI